MTKQLTYQNYLDGTKQILEESKKEKTPYSVEVSGKEFIVYPGVFSPKYFHDTEIFARHLPVKPGEALLEIGPGTGVVSITAAYKGAGQVLAVDINPIAVTNTQANIVAHHLESRVGVRCGDLYDPLKSGEKFDTIFWNVPFGLVPDSELSDLEKSIYDPGYESIERFIKEAKRYLKPWGRVLIGFSSTLGRLDLIQKFCSEVGLILTLLHEEGSEEVHPVKFEIFEAK